MTARAPNYLIVIANGEHARLVRPAHDNAMHTRSTLDSATAGFRSADLGSGRPGAAFHTGASAHHAIAPRRDPDTSAKQQFARVVAQQVQVAAKKSDNLELVLVAPAHILATIHEQLDAVTRSRTVGTLAKDLVKVPDHELQPHLKTWVRPIHHTAQSG